MGLETIREHMKTKTDSVLFTIALALTLLVVMGLAGVQGGKGVALRAAASRGEAGVVRSLLEGGASVDEASEYGATALILASMGGHADVVRVLLGAGADPDLADDFYRLNPLEWAAENAHKDVISLLFGSGAGGFDQLLSNAVDAADTDKVAELLETHYDDPRMSPNIIFCRSWQQAVIPPCPITGRHCASLNAENRSSSVCAG